MITRINIPDDFEIFLNETAGNYSGYSQNPNNNANRELVWKPYDFNVTAKPAFGHAALIVGYGKQHSLWRRFAGVLTSCCKLHPVEAATRKPVETVCTQPAWWCLLLNAALVRISIRAPILMLHRQVIPK